MVNYRICLKCFSFVFLKSAHKTQKMSNHTNIWSTNKATTIQTNGKYARFILLQEVPCKTWTARVSQGLCGACFCCVHHRLANFKCEHVGLTPVQDSTKWTWIMIFATKHFACFFSNHLFMTSTSFPCGTFDRDEWFLALRFLQQLLVGLSFQEKTST